ncbi:MAG: glycosyltransferase [Bacteroidota bacterium]|nr:glycosyltransferase [Bacteroidota bacterium]
MRVLTKEREAIEEDTEIIRQPTISIILPSLNTAALIDRALTSIHQQTYQNFEVLIIDNCSKDGTADVVKKFTEQDNRFTLICEKDNGIYDAMNKGIERSKGEWLYFLGADDSLYASDTLQNVAQAIIESADTEIFYGDVRLNFPFPNEPDKLIYDGKFDSIKLLKKCICHQSIFVRRSVFERFGNFNSKYYLSADYDFNLRCFNSVSQRYLDFIVAEYSTNGRSSQSLEGDKLFYKDFLLNMAVRYSYSYKDDFFKGRKKELFLLFKQEMKSFRLRSASRIGRILLHHGLLKKLVF